MCRHDCCGNSAIAAAVVAEEEALIAAEENLLIYCKPVEFYNILHRRNLRNPLFLPRCLDYKMQARRKRRLRSGIVVFNYRDKNNDTQKSEVTEDFSCPFCLMLCGSFKGLRIHLCSSHDLFEFDFWMSEDYQAVNVSVKRDVRSEAVAGGADPRLQTFFLCSRPRKRYKKDDGLKAKQASVQFLELDSPQITSEDTHNSVPLMNDGENSSKSLFSKKDAQNGWHGTEDCDSGCLATTEHVGPLLSSSSVMGTPAAMAQSSLDHECVKSTPGIEAAPPPARTRKLSAERSEARNYILLQKRQFYHSHRVQPMAMEQVMSDRDSEDEVDNDIADLEDRRMLDDFVDVSKDEKRFMHLWNSFVRKQRVIADGHVPWACEGFSKLHGKLLIECPPLFWSWRLFMIKLWNHGLLDASTINNCNLILERSRDEGSNSDNKNSKGDDDNSPAE